MILDLTHEGRSISMTLKASYRLYRRLLKFVRAGAYELRWKKLYDFLRIQNCGSGVGKSLKIRGSNDFR